MSEDKICKTNLALVVANFLLQVFVELNGTIQITSSGLNSTFIEDSLLLIGIGTALLSLFYCKQRWEVPVLCLIVYMQIFYPGIKGWIENR